MGASQSKTDEIPEQFMLCSKSDFSQQLDKIMKTRSCVIKTVVLPPGVSLDDPRLHAGEVVEEINYQLPLGDTGIWPEHTPFECDISSRLIPPAHGVANVGAHYSVFPDERFAHDRKCGICVSNHKRSRMTTW